jgi:outer membrane protein assembly factor BamB
MYFGTAYTGVSNGRDDRVPGSTWAVYALNAATGAFLWQYETSPIFGSPAVANGMVYAIDGAAVYALDANTGSLIWQYNVTSQSYYGSPTIADNVLYFTSADGTVNALNATTGSHIWSYKTAGEILNAPAVANGLVYVTSGPGIVYALNAATGAVVWQKQFGVTIGPPRSLAGSLGGQAVANGVLYVGIQRGPNVYDLYALDAGTGAVIWKKAAATHYRETPAVANGIVYVVSDKLYALNASTGAVIWQTQSPGDSPTVANGVLYTAYLSISAQGAVYGHVVAFDASTGALAWQYKTGPGGFNATMPSPVVVNGMIYSSLVGSPNQVGAFTLPTHRGRSFR